MPDSGVSTTAGSMTFGGRASGGLAGTNQPRATSRTKYSREHIRVAKPAASFGPIWDPSSSSQSFCRNSSGHSSHESSESSPSRLQNSNWVQALEGGIDSSRRRLRHTTLERYRGDTTTMMDRDKAPEFRVATTDFGLLIGAKRGWEARSRLLAGDTILAPLLHRHPPLPDRDSIFSGHGWVPIDDENCWLLSYSWHPSRPVAEFGEKPGHPAHYVPMHPGTRRPIPSLENDFLIDRGRDQRTRTFTGIANASVQDRATQETMGPIYDRTQEHLGSADARSS